MPTTPLTEEELHMLGYSTRLIAYAKELVRKADEAQRKVDAKKSQKLLVAQNG